MAYDMIRLIWKACIVAGAFAGSGLSRWVSTLMNPTHYKLVPDAKNIVIVGGSFGGLWLARSLSRTLPTGYRLIIIDKNSHFNYKFMFPRYSVVAGYEHLAFLPYNATTDRQPQGYCSRIQGVVVEITDTEVVLASGERVPYAYLAIATGSSQPPPVEVIATELKPACEEMRSVQRAIAKAQTVAVIGGGAVGVQLASDIKSFSTEKEVTLIHSRERLLNQFGRRLHEYALPWLQDELGIRVLLRQRPKLSTSSGVGLLENETLEFSDGQHETFDLVIACTGQKPNTSFLASNFSDAICARTSRVLVHRTMQIKGTELASLGGTENADGDVPARTPGGTRSTSQRIFVFGDVAETPDMAPKMARSAVHQAMVAHDNIIACIKGEEPSALYTPNYTMEGALKLTLGKDKMVFYLLDGPPSEDGSCPGDILLPWKGGAIDLGASQAWRMWGCDFNQAKDQDLENGEDKKSA